MTDTCTDCGGYLARAFASTADYLRCKRCGHVFPIVEPGAGCGTGSDGHPCSPAYLCPACIVLLLESEGQAARSKLY